MPNDRPIMTTHKVKRGDTLWGLAVKYYGLASQWRVIHEANKDHIGESSRQLKAGQTLKIPEIDDTRPDPGATGKDHLVKIDIANLEGRKVLQQPLIMLNGVGEEAASALQDELKIKSIFDLAVSRIFNGARDLVQASSVVAAEYTKYNFIPGDLIRGDPASIRSLDALLRADLDELNFSNQDFAANQKTADRLKQALSVSTVRDLALWPPFQAARQILNGTFNPFQVQEQDPEAPADLIPQTGNFATERVYYTSVVLTDVDPDDAKEDLRQAGPVDLMSGPLDEGGFRKPAIGVIVTTEQAWYAQGVTLGQLLHSLTLAPGESTKIAVVDWTRRTYGRTDQKVSQIEQLSQITDQARSISEITNALARETQHGTSVARGSSRSRESGVSGGFLGLFGGSSGASSNTSLATSVSRSSGTRRLSASMAQNILNRTQQLATSARSRRAAIVQETFQEEHEATTTRVVTNYNHMHALSIQYYEVVQVYRVKTRPVHYDRVLFIPMKPFNFNDPRVISRHRQVLEEAAQTPQRREQIKKWAAPTSHSVMDAKNAVAVAETVPKDWEPLNDAAQDIGNFRWTWNKVTGGRLERIEYRCAGSGEITAILIKPRYGGEVIRKDTGDANASAGEISFTYLTLDSISEIQLLLPADEAKRSNVTLVYHLRFNDTETPGAVLRQYVVPPKVAANGDQEVVHQVATVTTKATASDDLIDHLNENALYYSQAIWSTADTLALSRVLADYTHDGKSIITSIDLTPVAMTGNYLGFRWHFGSEEAREAWLEEKSLVSSESNSFEAMVPLPSGGVFAEAVLGRFNAAEKLDLGRFWNWQDSPIPILPPDINPVTMGSRVRDQDLKIDGLEAQAVHITQPPNLPDPAGMQAMIQSLAASNIFRDMSGLAATAGLAQTGLQEAREGASHASEEATKAYEIAAEHQRAMAKMAMEAAAQALPLMAGPAGGAGLAASNISKAGAVMNMAAKLDTSGDPSEASEAPADSASGGMMRMAFQSLLGRISSLRSRPANSSDNGAAKP